VPDTPRDNPVTVQHVKGSRPWIDRGYHGRASIFIPNALAQHNEARHELAWFLQYAKAMPKGKREHGTAIA
jgi:hypothetical protein